MRILHVGIGNLSPGGVSTYVGQVVAAQRGRGHEVVLAELWPAPEIASPADLTISSLDALPELARRTRCDVLHLHSQLPAYEGIPPNTVITAHEHSAHCPAGGRYLTLLRRECKKPYGQVGCLAGHFLFRCGSRDPGSISRRFEVTTKAIDFEGIWIAPSSYSRERLLERGMSPDRVRLVSNPGPEGTVHDAERPGPHGEFLFVGRLVPNKGCDVAIRAVARSPELRLRILGDGPSRSELESLATRLGVGDRVAFDGWCDRPEVERRLAECLALVVPSMWPEPFGLVALEAFAKGRPVLASRTGGLTDIVVPGSNGLLFRPGSDEQLCRAMTTLWNDRPSADQMGIEGARTLVTRFSMESHLESLEKIYHETRAPIFPSGKVSPP